MEYLVMPVAPDGYFHHHCHSEEARLLSDLISCFKRFVNDGWWGILPLWQYIQQLPGLYVSSSWQNSVSTDWELHCSPAFLCREVNYLFLWPGSIILDPADRARVRKSAGLHSRIRGLGGSIWNGILAQPPKPMESFSTICIPNSNFYFLFQLEVKIKFLNWLDMYGRLNHVRAVKLVTLASLQLLHALYPVRFTSAVSFFFFKLSNAWWCFLLQRKERDVSGVWYQTI